MRLLLITILTLPSIWCSDSDAFLAGDFERVYEIARDNGHGKDWVRTKLYSIFLAVVFGNRQSDNHLPILRALKEIIRIHSKENAWDSASARSSYGTIEQLNWAYLSMDRYSSDSKPEIRKLAFEFSCRVYKDLKDLEMDGGVDIAEPRIPKSVLDYLETAGLNEMPIDLEGVEENIASDWTSYLESKERFTEQEEKKSFLKHANPRLLRRLKAIIIGYYPDLEMSTDDMFLEMKIVGMGSSESAAIIEEICSENDVAITNFIENYLDLE